MRKYSVGITATSIAALGDLVSITAPATMAIMLTRAWVTQGSTVVSEQNLVVLQRTSTDNTTGATTLTPRPMEVGDPASSTTCRTTPTAPNTLTGDPIEHEGFNWVSGFLWVPAPEERIIIPPSGHLVLRLVSNPGVAKIVDAGVNFIELG